ncbi:MAG: amidohydrolase family protein [Bacteroidota bacterium]
MKKLVIALLGLFFIGQASYGQTTFPRNGVADHREGLYAFTNATIHVSDQQVLEKATLLIRRGKIEAVGTSVSVPDGAVTIDLAGKHVYPSFIEAYSNYGMPEVKRERRSRRGPQMLSNKEGAYSWNQALQPEFGAHEHFKADSKIAKNMRDMGFGATVTHRMDGISRGTSVVVHFGEARPHELLVKQQAAHHLSFNKGTSTQNYPSSLMGSIALLRQTYYDAQWYVDQEEEQNLSLEAWNAAQDLPQVFEIGDRLEALRAATLGAEFGKIYILKTSGDAYQRINEIKATGAPLIVPVNYPAAYDVEDPYNASLVNLAQMKHWELAASNLGRLEATGIEFAITTQGLKNKRDFLGNVRKAIEEGLSEGAALKALTSTPAKLFGIADQLGSLEKGKMASFIVTDKSIFAEGVTIYQNWVKGQPFVLKDVASPWTLGQYELKVGGQSYDLQIKGNVDKPKLSVKLNDTTDIAIKHTYANGTITLSMEPERGGGKVRLSGAMDGKTWSGNGKDAAGKWIDWSAKYVSELDKKGGNKKKGKGKKEEATTEAEESQVTYPFTAYGWTERPTVKTYLIKNATVWTNEKAGKMEGADVLVRDGKIAEVGKGLRARGAQEIDGTGMHLTPGIIDEHSHIAISRGVNEGTQVSSAEVRIGDVVNSEDVNIYRQLSGGVTAAQLLHGSANPIGGQSGIIKMRWGFAPEEMKIKGADGFIKFALGENVKQSNWGDDNRIRFPQTRMGVEQVFIDYFQRAKEYGEKKASGESYRRDLDLETLLEIIERKRFITCHSYQQGEINMLMKVAEQFDFTINTFTHILEGYKVADKMAKHGAGGSSFADWWAYKFEVYEAIPYNGALMHEQGVLVAYNSDDSEMARRLNQEAAKAVRFGGVSEEDALKFVTLNPAKLLHLDDRMGSIKVGKDADLVLWNDHPLSVYAKAEKTFVDGMLLFDRGEDQKMREVLQQERNRLIQKMLTDKKNGGKTQRPKGRRQYEHYHCDSLHDEVSELNQKN